MKTLTVSKADYDEILYPLVVMHTVEESRDVRVGTLRRAGKVLDKLEAAGEPGEAVPAQCPSCQSIIPLKSMVNVGRGVILYRMTDLSATFELEDAEAEFVAERLIDVIPRLAAGRARAIVPLLEMLEAA